MFSSDLKSKCGQYSLLKINIRSSQRRMYRKNHEHEDENDKQIWTCLNLDIIKKYFFELLSCYTLILKIIALTRYDWSSNEIFRLYVLSSSGNLNLKIKSLRHMKLAGQFSVKFVTSLC